MENSTVALFEVINGPESQLRDFAEIARSKNLHLVVEHFGVLIPTQSYFSAGSPYAAIAPSDEWADWLQKTNATLLAVQKDSRALLGQEGVSGEVRVYSGETATLGDHAAHHARLCDLSILGPSVRASKQAFNAVLYDLLFRSGGPVMINATPAALVPEHVMIAWNATLPASRAVRLALPWLKAAKQVTLATFDAEAERQTEGEDPGADAAKWLSHHGCEVTVQQYATGGVDVGASILRRARDVGADTVVMGAYAHTRLREVMFGGTTETMVRQTEMPVFLAH